MDNRIQMRPRLGCAWRGGERNQRWNNDCIPDEGCVIQNCSPESRIGAVADALDRRRVIRSLVGEVVFPAAAPPPKKWLALLRGRVGHDEKIAQFSQLLNSDFT